jgi:hypothetical protein
MLLLRPPPPQIPSKLMSRYVFARRGSSTWYSIQIRSEDPGAISCDLWDCFRIRVLLKPSSWFPASFMRMRCVMTVRRRCCGPNTIVHLADSKYGSNSGRRSIPLMHAERFNLRGTGAGCPSVVKPESCVGFHSLLLGLAWRSMSEDDLRTAY